MVCVPSAGIPLISIHALREEGDVRIKLSKIKTLKFLSTPSARRATSVTMTQCLQIWEFLSTPSARRATTRAAATGSTEPISIHALREEGDKARAHKQTRTINFYPRPPRGGRQDWTTRIEMEANFYPRPPRGGRPQKQRKNPCFYSIINHSAQNGKSCNCAEHERCVFCGKNIRFSGAKKTEKA